MYFGCSSGGGKGNNLIVTCASDFAGVTISCTKGAKSYSRVCPSSDPYEVEFNGLEAGTWTISGTVEGTLYSTSAVIVDYTATLDSGFNYKAWCTEGGVDATQYSSLADVFADELAVHKLMTIHASADYLIDAVSDDVNTIDDFCSNDNAMKWIGLRDYVCDGLTGINGVEAKFLASQYWERYLKDYVPTMTSNTAPYGVASAYRVYGAANDAYKVFDGDDSTNYTNGTSGSTSDYIEYEFPTPFCIKRLYVKQPSADVTQSLIVKGTNDGVNFTTLKTIDVSTVKEHSVDIANSIYFKKIRVYCGSSTNGWFNISTLQFYGRSLNVSVPKMTSNNSPFGAVSSNANVASREAYIAFDKLTTGSWTANAISGYLQYMFDTKVNIKMVGIIPIQESGVTKAKDCVLYGTNDGLTYSEALKTFETVFKANGDTTPQYFVVTTLDAFKGFKLDVTAPSGIAQVIELAFYGVDYSEREYEANSGKKWLYDHGLELEALTTSGTVTKGDDYLTLSAANSEATASVDLTDYSILRCKVGDHMSGTTQLSVGGSNPATATLTTNYAPSNFSLGTSLFDQPLATGVKMTSNGICDITELWLEQ